MKNKATDKKILKKSIGEKKMSKKEEERLISDWSNCIFAWANYDHKVHQACEDAALDDAYVIETIFEILSELNRVHCFLYTVIPDDAWGRFYAKSAWLALRKNTLESLMTWRMDKKGEKGLKETRLDILLQSLIAGL